MTHHLRFRAETRMVGIWCAIYDFGPKFDSASFVTGPSGRTRNTSVQPFCNLVAVFRAKKVGP